MQRTSDRLQSALHAQDRPLHGMHARSLFRQVLFHLHAVYHCCMQLVAQVLAMYSHNMYAAPGEPPPLLPPSQDQRRIARHARRVRVFLYDLAAAGVDFQRCSHIIPAVVLLPQMIHLPIPVLRAHAECSSGRS